MSFRHFRPRSTVRNVLSCDPVYICTYIPTQRLKFHKIALSTLYAVNSHICLILFYFINFHTVFKNMYLLIAAAELFGVRCASGKEPVC